MSTLPAIRRYDDFIMGKAPFYLQAFLGKDEDYPEEGLSDQELRGKRGARVRKEAMKAALLNFPKLLRDAPERLGKGAWSKILVLLQKVYKTKDDEATPDATTLADGEGIGEKSSHRRSLFHFFKW